MSGSDEYNQATAQPVDHEYAMGANNEINQDDSVMMECNTEDQGDGQGVDDTNGGPWISPYDESCDEEEEEEPLEWTSPPPSPYPAQSFGIDGDDEIFEEGLENDIAYGLHNIDIDNSEDNPENYEVHYIGLYKFVYLISKQQEEQRQQSENAALEPSTTEDANET